MGLPEFEAANDYWCCLQEGLKFVEVEQVDEVAVEVFVKSPNG